MGSNYRRVITYLTKNSISLLFLPIELMIIRILSVNGFMGRSAFAVYRGANVYYMSDTKGFDAGQVAKTSAQSFGSKKRPAII